jgi:hypothetical protein
MKFENTSSSKICEANLSIEIEDFINPVYMQKDNLDLFIKTFVNYSLILIKSIILILVIQVYCNYFVIYYMSIILI